MKSLDFLCNLPVKCFLFIFIIVLCTSGMAAAGDAETIEQLRQLLLNQQQQINMLKDEIRSIKQNAKMAAAPAQAEDKPQILVKSGNNGTDLKLYGQVNRGVLISDDGKNTDVFHVDNDNSSTRIGLLAKAHITEDFAVGSKIEVQFESNSTAAISQGNDSVGPNNFTERQLDLFLESNRLGKLSIGQGDTASNGTSEVDLSGTAVVGYSGVTDMAGGLNFINSSTGSLSGISIGSVMSNMDGLSRRDRLRYDTPSLGGFTLSGSITEDEKQDAALRYSGEMSGTKFAAAAAYAHQANNATEHQYNGSASLLFSNGINFTIAGGARNLETAGRDDPFFFYGKLGYKADFTKLGNTNFALDYGYFEDISQDNEDAQAIGFFTVQEFEKAGAEIYLGLRWYDLDRSGMSSDDVKAMLIGSRIKF